MVVIVVGSDVVDVCLSVVAKDDEVLVNVDVMAVEVISLEGLEENVELTSNVVVEGEIGEVVVVSIPADVLALDVVLVVSDLGVATVVKRVTMFVVAVELLVVSTVVEGNLVSTLVVGVPALDILVPLVDVIIVSDFAVGIVGILEVSSFVVVSALDEVVEGSLEA